jgi:hypothetical protein
VVKKSHEFKKTKSVDDARMYVSIKPSKQRKKIKLVDPAGSEMEGKKIPMNLNGSFIKRTRS